MMRCGSGDLAWEHRSGVRFELTLLFLLGLATMYSESNCVCE